MTIYSCYKPQKGVGLANSGTLDANTLSLVHFDGDDAATTFTDEIYGIIWTQTGSAQLDTGRTQFGVSSLQLLVLNDRATGASFATPHAGNWTVEGWLNTAATTTNTASLALLAVDGDNMCFVRGRPGDSELTFTISGDDELPIAGSTFTAVITADVQYHIAVVREGTSYSYFFNGTRLGTEVVVANMGTATQVSCLGEAEADSWWDEVRVSKIARYSGATYTVPAAAFILD